MKREAASHHGRPASLAWSVKKLAWTAKNLVWSAKIPERDDLDQHHHLVSTGMCQAEACIGLKRNESVIKGGGENGSRRGRRSEARVNASMRHSLLENESRPETVAAIETLTEGLEETETAATGTGTEIGRETEAEIEEVEVPNVVTEMIETEVTIGIETETEETTERMTAETIEEKEIGIGIGIGIETEIGDETTAATETETESLETKTATRDEIAISIAISLVGPDLAGVGIGSSVLHDLCSVPNQSCIAILPAVGSMRVRLLTTNHSQDWYFCAGNSALSISTGLQIIPIRPAKILTTLSAG